MPFQEPSRSVGGVRIKVAHRMYGASDGPRWAKVGHEEPSYGLPSWSSPCVLLACISALQSFARSTEVVMLITPAVLVRWIGTLSIGCISLCNGAAFAGEDAVSKVRSVQVAGSGTDLLSGEIVHSKRQTPNGMVKRSTGIVELKGDLIGRVLYHVTSTYDTTNDTLVNTGDQVFSGTVANSDPVMIHDAK